MTASANRTEYLAYLRSLVEKCRTKPDPTPPPLQLVKPALAAEPPDNWTQMLDSILQINERLDEMQQTFLLLEVRICALEKNAPSPQAWRDVVQGIRSIRNLVAAQISSTSEALR